LVAAAEFHLAKSGRLIIVDEAQHLTNEAVDLLRCLVDATEARLVLGGNNTVWDRFHAKGGIPYSRNHMGNIG
jgi:DNA transposition AAA+ family ATPase